MARKQYLKEAEMGEGKEFIVHEITDIVEDLNVIKDDKSSLMIVRAVTMAFAARCAVEDEKEDSMKGA